MDTEKECLATLQKLIEDDVYMTSFKELFEERFLLHFIRGRKYNSQNAFDTLKKYIEVRDKQYPDFFKQLLPSELKIQEFCLRPLKQLSKDGHVVVITRVAWWPHPSTSKARGIEIGDSLRHLVVGWEKLAKNEEGEIKGFEVIVDNSEFSFGHLTWAMKPQFIQMFLHLALGSSPLRLKGVHFVNSPSAFMILFKAAKALVGKRSKVLERMYMYNSKNYAEFEGRIGVDILPNLTKDADEAYDWDFHKTLFQEETDLFYKTLQKLIN